MHPSPEESRVLLFGSASSERRVSVASAQFIVGVMAVRPWFWTRSGAVIEVQSDQLLSHAEPFTRDFVASGRRQWATLNEALDTLSPTSDVVILAVHGTDGEDGNLQRMLEQRGLAFTGSDSGASARAFNKSETLAIAAAQGLRIPRGRVLAPTRAGSVRQVVLDAFDALGPIVVKPESDGSSVRLVFARDRAECEQAIDLLENNPGTRFRAEELVCGRELTIGVIHHDDTIVALPCSEIVVKSGRSFDYAGKYLGDGSVEITPAEIHAALREELHRCALEIHRALDCFGYSRSDFIVDDAGPVFLETNTLPGLTARSFVPQQLAAAQIPFVRFLEEQVSLARKRRATS